MKFIGKLVWTFILTFAVALQANAAIRISQDKFEFTVKPNSKFLTGSFTVQANTDETIRFKVYSEYFETSELGIMETGLSSDSPNSLVSNIRFNPTEFTLSSGKAQKVRFTITNMDKLSEGESRAALFLEDAKTKEQALPSESEQFSAYILLRTRVAVPIYVDKGKVIKTCSVDGLFVDTNNNNCLYTLNVKSSGNSKVRIKGTGQIIKDNKLIEEFPLNERPIQAGTNGLIQNEIPVNDLKQDEEYKLRMNLIYKDEKGKLKPLKSETLFKPGKKSNEAGKEESSL